MRKIVIFFMVLLGTCNVLAQSVFVQKGITFRYNGKNPRTPLGGVYVKTATSPNGVVSDENNGVFSLKLQNIKMGDRLGRATVSKKGLMVFNQQAVDEWSARKEPLKLILCDANQFQKQKNNLISIGRNQAEKKYKKRLAELEKKNKAQQLTLDEYHAKLDSINRDRDNAEKHMEEYADMFARIDESEVDTLAQRAIELFNQGQLEEAIKLFEQGNYLEKLDDALKVKTQAKELRQKADSADVLADKDIEEYKKSIQAQVSAYKMSNEWNKAAELLKGLADKLQTLDVIWNYAIFSQNLNQFTEAEKYYKLYKNKLSILANTRSEAYKSSMAACYNNLASLYCDTRRFTDSEQMYKSALEIYKRLADSNPQMYEPDLALYYNNLAVLYYFTRRFADSEAMHKSALEIRKRLAKSNLQTYEPDLAMSYSNLGILYSATRRFADSEQMHKSALEIRKCLAKSNPLAYEPILSDSYNNLGILYRATHRFADSEAMHKSALEIRKRLADSNPQTYGPALAMSYSNLGLLFCATQRFTDSEQMLKSALEIYKRLADSNPQVYNSYVAMRYNDLANLYCDSQRYADSEQMHKSALEIRKRLVDSNPLTYEPDLSDSYYNLGLLYRITQRFTDSERMLKSALEIRKRLADSNPQGYDSFLSNCYFNLGLLYSSTQRFADSEAMHKSALEIRKRLADTNPHAYNPDLAGSYHNLANLYSVTQRFTDSEQMYNSALEIYKRLMGENSFIYGQKLADCLFWFAHLQLKQGKTTEAISPLEQALEFYKKEAEQGKSIDYYTKIMSWLHQLYGQEKKYSQAYQCFKQNIPLLKTLYQLKNSNYTELLKGILVSQSFFAIFEKQYTEAENYSREALEVDSTKHVAYSNLAAALLFQGKYQEAEKIYRQYKSELKEGFLSDFEEFSKAGVIPKNKEEDVEKIKQLLLKE